MKSKLYPIIVAFATTVGVSSAAINVPAAGVTVDFATAPAAGNDFYSVSVAGGGATPAILGTGTNGMDNLTTGVSRLLSVPAAVTDWTLPANNYLVPATVVQNLLANPRYLSNGKMLFGPTGNAFQALIGTFTNGSGSARRNFELKFDVAAYFASAGTGAVGTDPLAGLHIYASSTGLIDSWVRVSGPHATGNAITQTATFGTAVANGGTFYIAVIDDNGPGSGTPNWEGNYTLDNLNVTPKEDTVTPTVTLPVRQDSGTLRNPADDEMTFTLNVTATDPSATTWVISKPGSFLNGQTGTYGTPKNFAVPIAEFTPGLTFAVHDLTATTITANATVTAPICALTATYSGLVYDEHGTPADTTDDTVAYNVTADGPWTGPNYNLDLPAATVAPYATNTAHGGLASAAPFIHNFVDSTDANCKTQLVLNVQQPIGTNELGDSPMPLYSLTSTGLRHYTTNHATRVTTHVAGAGANVDYVLETPVLDLSAVGGIQVLAELEALPRTGTSGSGFEAADYFQLQLIIDGGAPVSILGTNDKTVPPDGKLSGNAALGTELPGATAPATDIRAYTFSYSIPQSANSVQLRATSNTNSDGETLILKNVRFISDGPRLLATSAGPVTRNNKGTVSPADDIWVAPYNLNPSNITPSTGWVSDLLVAPEGPASGLYATPNPVNLNVTAAKSVIITDSTYPGASATVAIVLPVPTVTVVAGTAPAVTRVVNGPGNADDTVDISISVTSSNVGPEFTVTPWFISADAPSTITQGATTTLTYGTNKLFTLHNVPATASNIILAVRDASYPTVVANYSVAVPAAAAPLDTAVIGQKDLGGGLSSLNVGVALPAAWINYPASRELAMITGAAADADAVSETLDLTTVGAVNFSAKFIARDNSPTSNFEIGDKFKIELVVDGAVVPLLTAAQDTGNGAATPDAAGASVLNGAANGYLNGYSGVVVAPATTGQPNYDEFRVRDEFNTLGENAATQLNNTFTFSHVIPAGANNAFVRISGAGISGSEGFLVKDVLFQVAPAVADTDGDGMSDAYESAHGLNPAINDAAADLDGDGSSNLEEFLAGTAANSATSVLKIVDIVAAGAGQYSVTWDAVAGKKYQLEESTDLGQADPWANVGPVVTATSAVQSSNVTIAAPGHHFVRAKVVP